MVVQKQTNVVETKRVITHYRTNYDTGERTLNTDINIYIILNGLAYIANLVLIFTVGPFGGVSSTTTLLAYNYQSPVTVDEIFFKLAWGFIIPWQAFWAVWQIANPAERNCEGVVRAAFFYPIATLFYAGYTISCRVGMFIMAAIFCAFLCGTLVGLAMSMQRYREKIWKGYLIWQGPLTLHAAWIMVEMMLVTNVIFVRTNETSLIKTIIAGVSVLVIFITAIAWLSSYPVDLIIPFVLMCAIGGIYLELETTSHYRNLIRQDYSNTTLDAFRWAILVVFVLIAVAFIIKVIIVLLYHRPKDQIDRRKKKESRVSVSITIDTGANNNNNNKKKNRNNRNNNRRAPRDEYGDDYYDNDYDNEYGTDYDNGYGNNSNYNSPPSTPVSRPKKKSARTPRDGRYSPSPSPKKKRSPGNSPRKSPGNSPRKSPRKSPGGKTKKKSSSSNNKGETSATSAEDDDSMA
jgi:hypothetical protein